MARPHRSPYADRSAHNQHMQVFLDQQGRCYVHTNPDGKLYFVAETFSEAAELLLLGHAWGRVVEALVS